VAARRGRRALRGRRKTGLSTSSVGSRRQLSLKIARASAEARLPRRGREAISRGKQRVSPLMTLSCLDGGRRAKTGYRGECDAGNGHWATTSSPAARELPLKIARASAEARLPRRGREAISRGKQRVSPLMTLSCLDGGRRGGAPRSSRPTGTKEDGAFHLITRCAGASTQNRPCLCGGAFTAAKPRGDFKGETACFPLDDPLLLWTGDAGAGRGS
jgi:hypothetical protein